MRRAAAAAPLPTGFLNRGSRKVWKPSKSSPTLQGTADVQREGSCWTSFSTALPPPRCRVKVLLITPVGPPTAAPGGAGKAVSPAELLLL
eukprot:CAMPEP_0206432354 /NCGR_PEP_ID=MMETSP0324_2-20121206/7875_1 /ASSEMBLY_ACC=CAM_ASM_000836 /TAXON_ID=2866 /ORGANISM="Crypthecodinium cohnii, Strain Seligo" /LENGTH=89 /DNA_ID=CAMNT_0053898387 /DNA_START=27 /DNA_END=296 /DNA_ORIENTATION=-